ncbi:MAG: class 1 fructose-bisphosphatase [Janthinobacterium lividum]
MAKTLFEHVREQHTEELAHLLAAIATAAVTIEAEIRTAGLNDVLGAAGHENVQGEQQQKLDVFANNTLVEAMRAQPTVAAVVSEEDDEPIVFAGRPDAKFVAIFDPLDGSSNIDVNVNVGTIVSIQAVEAGGDATAAAMQPGTAQVAALYVNYGPSTILVYTAGKGVHSFTLADGNFVLSAENMVMPLQGPYYSMNEGNLGDSPPLYSEAVAGLRDGSLTGHKHSSRYVGSFIADFHRTLLKGGVFLYPPTKKTPNGKLRLLYEANPLSLIAEQAGGAATDEHRRILEIMPTEPHVRTPLIIGSQAEVSAIGNLLKQTPRE